MPKYEYKQLFDTLIANKAKVAIIEYSNLRKAYDYKPFSHHSNSKALDDLFDLIIDNMVFYAFSEDEIVSLHVNVSILDDLRSAAKYAFAERLPKRSNPNSDGTLGEVLLDLLIQAYEPSTEKLVARAKYTEVGKKSEITGYDALYFTKSSDIITLWLGQAKAGNQQYCMGDMKNDLNTKFTLSYFSETAFYIATRTTSSELLQLVNEINKLCFQAQLLHFTKEKKVTELFNILKINNVLVKIPCLIAYTNDIYADPQYIQEKIEECRQTICSYFDCCTYSIEIPLHFDIVFYIFPIKDVSYVRGKIAAFKKEVYNQ